MNIRISTKEAIIESAFQLFKDNPRASLAEIARFAGVGRVTLHRYFSGRDDLVLTLAKQAIRELDSAAESAAENAQTYTDALRLMLTALVPLADRQWFLDQLNVDEHPEIQLEYDRQRQEMISLFEAAKNEGEIPASVPNAWACHVFDCLLYAAWETVRAEEATNKQAAELAFQTLMVGIGGLS